MRGVAVGGMSIGFLGGLPPLLGGGGVDDQMRRTKIALEGLGHQVVHVDRTMDTDYEVQVLHAFAATANVWFYLSFQTRSTMPVVLSPISLNARAWNRGLTPLLSRVRLGYRSTLNMTRELCLGAAELVALTEHERGQLRALGADAARISVIPNGSDADTEHGPRSRPARVDAPLLMVGAIQARKRQAAVVRALPDHDLVIAGALMCSAAEQAEWTQLLSQRPRATWVGHVSDRARLLDLYAAARAVILLSRGEGQSLAVLDALALGVPVVLSDLAGHRELAARFPSLVVIVRTVDELRSALGALPPRADQRPAGLATWSDVGGRLAEPYRGLLPG